MAQNLNLAGLGARVEIGNHRVYFRQRWADGWTQLFGAHCLEATWSVQPAVGSATVEWDYGHNSNVGFPIFAPDVKTDATGKRRWFVKIAFECHRSAAIPAIWNTRDWYGVVEDIDDQQGGATVRGDQADPTVTPHGRVRLICYGLEKLLYDSVFRSSVADNFVGSVGTPLSFNVGRNGGGLFPNMSDQPDGAGVHVFAATAPNSGQPWNSREAIRYLLRYHTPQNWIGQQVVKWELDGLPGAPAAWDRPQLIVQEGTNSGTILNQLIDRRRLQVWFCDVNEQTNAIVVRVRTLTAAAVPVDLAGADPIPANPQQLHVRCDQDPLTSVSVRSASVQQYDQVFAFGAFRRYVGTFSFAAGNLHRGWSISDEAAYETAASNTAGYDAAGTKEQQRRNAQARGRAGLQDVFSKFCVPATWDFTAGTGLDPAEPNRPMLVDPILGGKEPQPWSHLYLQQTLPLLAGVDYSGDKIAAGTFDTSTSADRLERRPLVLMWRPEGNDPAGDSMASPSTVQGADPSTLPSDDKPDRWVNAEEIGRQRDAERSTADKANLSAADQNERFSLSVEVPANSHCFVVRVQGEIGQHAIAGGEFTRLPADQLLGSWAFNGGKPLLATLSIKGTSRCAGWWPKQQVSGDTLRTKVIMAGDEYTQDYVTPGTVVDVDENGKLVTSTGGWIPKQGDDNAAKLDAIARIAGSWYTQVHQVAALSTYRLLTDDQLPLGGLVLTIGGRIDNGGNAVADGHAQTINGIVSQVTLQVPRGTADQPAEPRLHVMTWAGELDALNSGPIMPRKNRRHGPLGPDPSRRQRLEAGTEQLAPGFQSAAEAAFFNNDPQLRDSMQRAFDNLGK